MHYEKTFTIPLVVWSNQTHCCCSQLNQCWESTLRSLLQPGVREHAAMFRAHCTAVWISNSRAGGSSNAAPPQRCGRRRLPLRPLRLANPSASLPRPSVLTKAGLVAKFAFGSAANGTVKVCQRCRDFAKFRSCSWIRWPCCARRGTGPRH